MTNTKSKIITEAKITKRNIHQQLLQIAARELSNLPDLLEQLTPSERVRVVMQILPYTAPKVQSVGTLYGEVSSMDWD